MKNRFRIASHWILAFCWTVIGIQGLYIIQTRNPELLQSLGIEKYTYQFFTKTGLLHEDPFWELSRDEDRTELKQALRSIDRYSTYLSEDQFESFSIDSHQEYEGIGVSLQKVEQGAEVREVFEPSPAHEAGLLPGDIIAQIDGHQVSNWDFNYLIEQIRGSSGTPLRLGIVRDDDYIQITLRRGSIDIPSIRNSHLTEDGIIYLKVEQFGEKTAREFLETLRSYSNQPIQGLVIDLRENTGGIFKTSIDMLDTFYDRGELMLETRNTSNNRSKTFKAKRPNILGNIPTVILVNRNSASASEILAGSLQVTGKALIVGEKTLGKGSIQTVFRLKQGDGYKKTTSYYYLPDGSSIHEVGILPDVSISMTQREYLSFRVRDEKGIPPYAAEHDPYWETALKYIENR